MGKISKQARTPGWALPYITYTACAAQRCRDFEAPDLERGIQRRFLERGIKNCGSRLYLLLKIVAHADYEEAFI